MSMRKMRWMVGSFVLGALIGCAEPDGTATEAITPGLSAPDDGAFEAGTDAPSDNLAPQDGADVPVDSDPDVTIPRDGDVVLPPDADADDAAPDGDDVMVDRLDVPPTPDVPTDSDAATSPDADVPSTPDADARADVPAACADRPGPVEDLRTAVHTGAAGPECPLAKRATRRRVPGAMGTPGHGDGP
jgi:hypothetical protein